MALSHYRHSETMPRPCARTRTSLPRDALSPQRTPGGSRQCTSIADNRNKTMGPTPTTETRPEHIRLIMWWWEVAASSNYEPLPPSNRPNRVQREIHQGSLFPVCTGTLHLRTWETTSIVAQDFESSVYPSSRAEMTVDPSGWWQLTA